MTRGRLQMGIVRLLVGVLALLSGLAAVEPAGQAEEVPEPTPVLVELFTSEGCSSCPPADRLLAELDREQPVPGSLIIPLAQHVDYWNRLGWTDRFSSSAATARQSEYGRAFRGRSIYTPQMVVDGQAELVGSDRAKALAVIARATQLPKARLSLTPTASGFRLRVEQIPAATSDDVGDVFLAITEDEIRSEIPRGENAGLTLTHRAVVRRLSVIGSFRRKQVDAFVKEVDVPLAGEWHRAQLRAVVFVQERASHRVLGAASVRYSPVSTGREGSKSLL